MSWTCAADHRLTDAHNTETDWPNHCAMCEVERARLVLMEENRIQAALFKQLDQIIRDMDDEESACRILLAKWDRSDSYGVVPLSDVVEIAIAALIGDMEP